VRACSIILPSIGKSFNGSILLETVTVSAKYQVVIPRAIRRSLGIQPGQKVQVLRYGDRIEYVPVKPMRRMRGFLKGIDTSVQRDADRL